MRNKRLYVKIKCAPLPQITDVIQNINSYDTTYSANLFPEHREMRTLVGKASLRRVACLYQSIVVAQKVQVVSAGDGCFWFNTLFILNTFAKYRCASWKKCRLSLC